MDNDRLIMREKDSQYLKGGSGEEWIRSAPVDMSPSPVSHARISLEFKATCDDLSQSHFCHFQASTYIGLT